MKKQFTILTLVSTLLIGACTTTRSTSTSNQSSSVFPDYKEVPISFNKALASDFEIDSHIYGGFLECFNTYGYGAVWSELVMDRKFIKPVDSDISRWTIVTGQVEMDEENPYQGDYSLILNKGDKIKNLDKIPFLKKDYVGYFWAKGNGTIVINIDDSSTMSFSIEVNSSDYRKYEYSFTSSLDKEYGYYYLACTNGSASIDSISLMPSDNYKGMRKDVLDLIKQTGITYLRFPGGNMVSGYDWREAIGNKDKNDYVREPAWHKWESDFNSDEERLNYDLNVVNSGSIYQSFYSIYNPNDFGLDEYIELCRYVDCEPNVIVNSGNGTPQMAAQQVEYCNGSPTSEWGSKRPQQEPYNVKIWGVGNEMQGDWQIGHVDIATYAARHLEFVDAMRTVDSNIEIIACGENNSGWSAGMLARCGEDNIDYLSEHFYTKQEQRSDDSLRLYIIKLSVDNLKERVEKHQALRTERVKMAIDEWAYEGVRNGSKMRDGYAAASMFMGMQKYGEFVALATYAFLVGGNGMVDYHPFGAHMQCVGFANAIFAQKSLNRYMPIEYTGGGSNRGFYEISATVNEDCSKLSLSVINTNDYALKISSNGFISAEEIDYVQGGDELSCNTVTDTTIVTRQQKEISGKSFFVEPRSISIITISI